jgi:hypothetical protein
VPNREEQMVRYYGYYSNVSRGKRTKQDLDGIIPSMLEPGGSSKAIHKSWLALTHKGHFNIVPLRKSKFLSSEGRNMLAEPLLRKER